MITFLRNAKFRVKARRYDVQIFQDDKYYYLKTPYSPELIAEIKLMGGARWMGYEDGIPYNFKKTWRVDANSRNDFTFEYLEEKNPYRKYMTPTEPIQSSRPLFDHQAESVAEVLLRKQMILAHEMGTGKTLTSIEIIERSGRKRWWFIGTKSSILSVQHEFRKWKCPVMPEFMTYDRLTSKIKNWNPGDPAPEGVFFDESHSVKTPRSQRAQAAFHLAESMRKEHGSPFIVLMTGTPSPKSPLDWYWQCEIACPGYLAEGNIDKFRNRLAIMEKASGMDGVTYPKLVAWRDGSDERCGTCGYKIDDIRHSEVVMHPDYHQFVKMPNEIEKLYTRMKGLVSVRFKKDCIDLPEKVYKIVEVPPTIELKRAAALINATSKTTIEALIRHRELSDGFQYKTTTHKDIPCPKCNAKGCLLCNDGYLMREERIVQPVNSPKLEALMGELEDLDDNRCVIYAGFTASIDRICERLQKEDWSVIRVDGRGWFSTLGTKNRDELYPMFQDPNVEKKIAFVGHPGSAGTGLTLTQSKVIYYYSNDFNGVARSQSEDRIHRPGSRGALIVDFFHLPTDKLVYDNLKAKRDLEKMSLGEVQKAFQE